MFLAAEKVGRLAVQLCWYRGFDEFRAEPWVTDARDLLARMSAVACRGGQTQIVRVLQHAAAETRRERVAALVFVGDCMEEDIDRLCHVAGELGMLGCRRSCSTRAATGRAARLRGGGAVDPRRLLPVRRQPADRDLLAAAPTPRRRRALEDSRRRRGGAAL
jgi:hypothetical protein